jgi:hypothetical protein
MKLLHVPFPLICLYWHGIICALATMNYSFWVRFQDFLPQDFKNGYIAFCIIGFIGYAVVGGPSFFISYKYGATHHTRITKLQLGVVVMYFSSVLPLFWLEFYITYKHGILYVLDGICLGMFLISWVVGSLVVWFSYMYQVARFLQNQTGADRQVAFAPKVGKMPQISFVRPVAGQPMIV